jgi:hypothetical protein
MIAEFEIKRRNIKNWLDSVIQAKKKLKQLSDSHYDDFGIELCSEVDEVHIYKGLETIAFYLGKTVIYNPMWSKDKGRMYFRYDEREVFQLWSKRS